LDLLKEVKEVRRERLTAYAEQRPSAEYHEGESVWSLSEKGDIALPCATQNEIDEEAAKRMIQNGVKIVAEGANMPCTAQAVSAFQEAGVWHCPGKAANAGGVAVSALEMSQNAQRLVWERKEVEDELDQIMKNIYETCRDTAAEYGEKQNLTLGANIAGFEKVASAMYSQGLV
jgi:glutamate dehydrogenase (NADP+)